MAQRMTAPKQGQLPIIKFGVYGAAGQGKTTLLEGFHTDPRTGPSLWLNVGGNPQMLLKRGTLDFAIGLDNFQDFLEPLNFLLTNQPERHPFRKRWDIAPDFRFKSLVIDTFSDLQGLLIDSVVGIKSEDIGSMDVQRIEVPSPTTHGKEIAGKTLFAARQMLLALNLHVFVSFQEFDNVVFIGDESGKILSGTKKAQISLWGQSRMKVPTWLNLMGRMYWMKGGLVLTEVSPGKKINKPDFYPVITWVDDEAHVKNQLAPSLGQQLDRPSADKILNLIEQDYKGET